MDDPQIDEQPRRRTGGRSARVRESVLRAVLDTLAEGGFDAMTMNTVARRAGVHATSVQRRWGTREKLVLDAMLSYSGSQLHVPDTGSLRGDLTSFAEALAQYLELPLGRMLAGTMAVVDDDPDLAAARAEFWATRFDAVGMIVERAVERGELVAGTDPVLLLEMLTAPLHFRALLTREPIDAERIDRIVDVVVRGFA
jgi:AcrR family transcriptional regulator